jgi:hypothetical protein
MREFEEIKALRDWSMNYDFPSPYSVFLDLIGWSKDELGEPLVKDLTLAPLGYLELDYLSDALKEVANHGQDAYDYAASLLEEEASE